MRGAITTLQADKAAGQKENPHLMTSIDQELDRVMAIGNQLLEHASRAIPDYMVQRSTLSPHFWATWLG
jgi:hypothetical protein